MKNFTIITISVFIAFFSTKTIHAQIVISKPNLGFSQACASPDFNTYNVTFIFSPESGLSSSNQFIIELSDETGDFSNPSTIYTSIAGAVTTSPATLNFEMPTTISGEAYRLRIKSTSPIATSTRSDAFAAYYKTQDTPFSINNLISTAIYCSGGSYLLTIDNPGTGLNDSPLNYPWLTFNWYKETSPTTSVFVDSGVSLSVTEPGIYFAETNYGTCTSDSFSNRVSVEESDSGVFSSITSSLGNPFCASQGVTTLSTISGDSYKWFRNGEEIEGATSQMYETDEFGEFSVNINLGNCTTSASINLENTGFTSSIDVLDVNTVEENETLTATIITNAVNPQYEWYLNDSLIVSAVDDNYEVTETGNYKVIITQTTGCVTSSEFLFTVNTPFPNVANIPNLISPNGDGINDTWIIPQEYVSGTNTEVLLVSAQGKIVLKTNDYQNNWPVNQIDFKDVNPVYYYIITPSNNKPQKGSITVVK